MVESNHRRIDNRNDTDNLYAIPIHFQFKIEKSFQSSTKNKKDDYFSKIRNFINILFFPI